MNKGKPRGRTLGMAVGQRRPGSATSAAKMNALSGVKLRGQWVWIPGEGWVEWREIERQVDEKFNQWLWRKAMQGVKLFRSHEYKWAQIVEAQHRRAA